MKKYLLLTAAASIFAVANAQNVIERPTAGDNWQIGVDAGVTTPLTGHSFFGNMRPAVGVHVGKQFTPLFGAGVESMFGINTSTQNRGISSKTAFDNSYLGAYATLNLSILFGGFTCEPRKFTVDALLGAGWGHKFNAHDSYDPNEIDVKAGLNFNFNISRAFGISLKPSVVWNLISQEDPAMKVSINRASFNLAAGFNFFINNGYKCVEVPADLSGEVSALNAKVNELRAALDDSAVALAASNANAADLAAALAACEAKPATVVKETTNELQSVRYVFFRLGSSVITADQMPNVEMVAEYLKHHAGSTVVIKGYASPDGSIEVNERLAKARAESVKNSLIKKYKVAADRITAEGQGIGTMFSEESWNRVAICTIDDATK